MKGIVRKITTGWSGTEKEEDNTASCQQTWNLIPRGLSRENASSASRLYNLEATDPLSFILDYVAAGLFNSVEQKVPRFFTPLTFTIPRQSHCSLFCPPRGLRLIRESFPPLLLFLYISKKKITKLIRRTDDSMDLFLQSVRSVMVVKWK